MRGRLKPSSIDWAVAAAAGVSGETAERGLRLLGVGAGNTIFIDGGAGGVGAVTVQMAVARGAKVIASSSEANHGYLREIGATPVLYGEGVADRVAGRRRRPGRRGVRRRRQDPGRGTGRPRSRAFAGASPSPTSPPVRPGPG